MRKPDDQDEPAAAAPQQNQTAWRGWLRRLSPLFGLAILAVAIWVLHHELSEHSLAEVWAHLRQAKPSAILATLGLCAVSFIMLALIERAALQMLHHERSFPSVLKSAFVTYGLSNALGYAFATAPAARARVYRGRLRHREVAALSALTAWSVALGAATAAGLSLLFGAPKLPALGWGGSDVWRWIGGLMLAPGALWIALSVTAPGGIGVKGINFRTLGVPRSISQVVFTTIDWLSTAGILYLFLPQDSGWTYPAFVSVFVAAGILGAVSGTPGGLGPFEAAILTLAPASASGPALVAALVAYRVVFTLTPLGLSAAILAVDFLYKSPSRSG